MGNSTSYIQDNSNVNIIKKCDYKFPSDDMSYDPEDLLIVKYISTLMFIDKHGGLDTGFFVWSMKNQTPHVYSFEVLMEYDTEIFFFLTVSLDKHLTYSVIDGEKFIVDRILVQNILLKIIRKRSAHVRIKREFVTSFEIYRPSSDIHFLDRVWDIIWDKCCYDQLDELNSMTVWNVERERVTFGGIVTKECIFKFCHSMPAELYLTRKKYSVYNLYYWDEVSCKEECEKKLSSYIKNVLSLYVQKHLYDNWILEKEEYDSYIQWLPNEVLEDTIALI